MPFQHAQRQGEVRTRKNLFLEAHRGATGRLPAGVLGAIPPEYPDSVGYEVLSGMRWVDDEAYAGGSRCEEVETETEEGEPIATRVKSLKKDLLVSNQRRVQALIFI